MLKVLFTLFTHYIFEQRTIELEDYIMDLCDKDCPNEYKNVVKSELYKHYNDSK